MRPNTEDDKQAYMNHVNALSRKNDIHQKLLVDDKGNNYKGNKHWYIFIKLSVTSLDKWRMCSDIERTTELQGLLSKQSKMTAEISL